MGRPVLCRSSSPFLPPRCSGFSHPAHSDGAAEPLSWLSLSPRRWSCIMARWSTSRRRSFSSCLRLFVSSTYGARSAAPPRPPVCCSSAHCRCGRTGRAIFWLSCLPPSLCKSLARRHKNGRRPVAGGASSRELSFCCKSTSPRPAPGRSYSTPFASAAGMATFPAGHLQPSNGCASSLRPDHALSSGRMDHGRHGRRVCLIDAPQACPRRSRASRDRRGLVYHRRLLCLRAPEPILHP